jgi:hypothetical protein
MTTPLQRRAGNLMPAYMDELQEDTVQHGAQFLSEASELPFDDAPKGNRHFLRYRSRS